MDTAISKIYDNSKLFLPRTILYTIAPSINSCHLSWVEFACLNKFRLCDNSITSVNGTAKICTHKCEAYLNNVIFLYTH